MTGILDQIRKTTVADLDKVTGDFSDLPASVYRPRVPRDMVRVVEGADDLKVDRPKPAMPGMIGSGTTDTRPYQVSTTDRRTEGQVRYMDNLISWITEKDAEIGRQAREYTDRMTENGRWEPGRDSNVSWWIDRLKAKNAELNAAAKSSPVIESTPTGNVEHSELIVRETKTGKPRPMYYALRDEDGTVKFYRVKAGTKPGWWWIDAQASDEFHPIRNVARKNDILRAIIAAGPEASMRLYGQELGSCGRCHRTLTDETSRANGIGPECEGMI